MITVWGSLSILKMPACLLRCQAALQLARTYTAGAAPCAGAAAAGTSAAPAVAAAPAASGTRGAKVRSAKPRSMQNLNSSRGPFSWPARKSLYSCGREGWQAGGC